MIKNILTSSFFFSVLFLVFQYQVHATEILAHRGASGDYPQGTWLAFQKALEQGSDQLELDVHLSKDAHIIINHDADLEANVGIDDKIKELTLAQLKTLDAGHEFSKDGGASYPYRGLGISLLTLDELFDYFPHEKFNIEIKANDEDLSESLWNAIEARNLQGSVVVASQHTKAMNHFREVSDGEVKTSATIAELVLASVAWSSGFGWAYKPKFEVAQIPYAIITKPYIKFFHKKGVRADVWTVNDMDDIERALDLGVDSIIGDYPDRIYQALVNIGERPEL
jgi:glycerophosphoryl diester phosphodiesterase